MGPLSTVGVDAMAFLHSKTQVDNPSFEVDEEPGQLHGRLDKAEDGRPDYQLLFMSSWLLGDYWTLVWKTFGLDGPKAWEGCSETFTNFSIVF